MYGFIDVYKRQRKNNPAVELMKKVIAHKKNNKLSENDYYQYNKYQKITMSLNLSLIHILFRPWSTVSLG